MKENLDKNVRELLNEFERLNKINKLYMLSILISHLEKGLINDGNYLDSDIAYENDKLVLNANDINLDDPMKFATNILILSSTLNNKIINPNGIDIEPYVDENSKNIIKPLQAKFYKLNFKNKIDFLTEIVYVVSEIQETNELDFDFNGLINELLTYSKNNFFTTSYNNLELENE